MIKLLNEVREIKRKMSLPLVREGSRGRIVSHEFTEREADLMIEMLTRRSKRDITADKTGHIFPEKMKSMFTNSTQKRAMQLIREGKWVI